MRVCAREGEDDGDDRRSVENVVEAERRDATQGVVRCVRVWRRCVGNWASGTRPAERAASLSSEKLVGPGNKSCQNPIKSNCNVFRCRTVCAMGSGMGLDFVVQAAAALPSALLCLLWSVSVLAHRGPLLHGAPFSIRFTTANDIVSPVLFSNSASDSLHLLLFIRTARASHSICRYSHSSVLVLNPSTRQNNTSRVWQLKHSRALPRKLTESRSSARRDSTQHTACVRGSALFAQMR